MPVIPQKDITGRECPECGELRQACAENWSGNTKKRVFRCVNKTCIMYGKRTMKVRE